MHGLEFGYIGTPVLLGGLDHYSWIYMDCMDGIFFYGLSILACVRIPQRTVFAVPIRYSPDGGQGPYLAFLFLYNTPSAVIDTDTE